MTDDRVDTPFGQRGLLGTGQQLAADTAVNFQLACNRQDMQKDEAKTPRLAWLDNLGEHLDVSLELYHHFTSLSIPFFDVSRSCILAAWWQS